MDELLAATFRFATPLAFAALGGVLSERSGVFNIALEGSLLCGAFGAAIGLSYWDSVMTGFLFGVSTGICTGTLLALMTVTLGANQFVSGIAVNMLCFGLTSFFARILGDELSKSSERSLGSVGSDSFHAIPILGSRILWENSMVFLAIGFAILFTIALRKTRTGMHIRAVGENQKAADSAGIPVNGVRFFCVLFSCVLASIGGCQLVLGQVHMFTENMTAGRGFIALAAVIIGRRTFWGAGFACLLFALCEVVELRLQFYSEHIPYQIFTMLPYILALVVLVSFAKPTQAADDVGQVFVRTSK